MNRSSILSRCFLLVLLLGPAPFLSGDLLKAQTYNMQNGSVTTCSGTFFDSGGGGAQYGNNETFTYTICPGAGGSDIRVTFSSFDVEGSSDELCVYDGNSTAATLVGCYSNANMGNSFSVRATNANASGCLTFQFDSDASGTENGWQGTIDCVYPCQDVEAVLNSTSPSPAPSSGEVEICPGSSVTFNGDAVYPENDSIYHQENSTSTFVWELGDGTVDTGISVTHTYNNSGIYTARLTVVDSNGCESINTIGAGTGQVVVVAPKPDLKGTTAIKDSICKGSSNTLIGVAESDTMYETCTPPIGDTTVLPDGSGVSYSSSVAVGCYAPGQTLNDVSHLKNICLNIEHSYIGDLTIELTCPSGQTITLADPYNGTGSNQYLGEPVDNNTGVPGTGYQYCFNNTPTYGTWNTEISNGYTYSYTDNLGNPVTGHEYLPAGSYQSEEPLSNLLGCPLNGNWEITITDNIGIDDGHLFNWSLSFADSILPPSLQDHVGIDSTYWNGHPDVLSMSANKDTAVVEPSSTGQRCYTYTAIDSFGCSWDTTACFEVYELQISTSSDTSICIGGTATMSAEVTVGSGSYTYHWSNGLGTGPTQTVSPVTDTSYEVYASSISGCFSDTLSVQVLVHDSLQVNATALGGGICPGDTVLLTASGSGGVGPPYTYDWSNGDSGDTVIVTPDSTQEYVVTLEDTCQTPAATDTVTVNVNPLPTPRIGGRDLSGCKPVMATLTNVSSGVVPGSDCSWDLGDGNSANACDTVLHQYDEPGCYDVQLTVETPAGCVDSSTAKDLVCVHPIPDAAFDFRPEETTYLDPKIRFTDQSSGATHQFWKFADLDSTTSEDPTFTFPDKGPGTYEVCLTAISSEHCRDTTCNEVVIGDRFFLYVPNAFTPDGDGINDVFRPVIKGMDPGDYRLTILDRWGKVVFRTKDPEEGWDGSIKGSSDAGKTDVFVWKIVTKNRHTGEGVVRQGHVTLIR